ncbi:MAG: hypothetical protein AB7G23_01220 [Vicinamibacterales bacterium]
MPFHVRSRCLRVLPVLCLLVATTLGGTTVALADPPAVLRGTSWVAGRPQGSAVVWLEAPATPDLPAEAAALGQRTLPFLPQVLAVRVGTTVRVPSSDRVFHHVFSFRDGRPFDPGVSPVGSLKEVLFDRPGVSRPFWNGHPQMAGYVVAVDTPYFATSDARGAFRIEAPAGRYTWRAWRVGGPEIQGTVVVGGEAGLRVTWP